MAAMLSAAEFEPSSHRTAVKREQRWQALLKGRKGSGMYEHKITFIIIGLGLSFGQESQKLAYHLIL